MQCNKANSLLIQRLGTEKVARLLIQHGANVDAQNVLTQRPLHLAVEYGHEQIVNDLLKNGAERNARTKNGETPLDIAKKKSKH